MIWRAVFWFLKLLPLMALGVFLHFYLPHKDVVRIVDTDVKRMDVVSRDLVAEDTDRPYLRTRDVRFVNAAWPDGVPRVYRNEETGWGFPWYFKFDSGNIQSEAQDLRSTKENPVWVEITNYGWRIELFSMFPNAVNVERVEGPDHFSFPWFNTVFLTMLAVLFFFIWRAWRRFMEKLALDERFENASNSVTQVYRWFRANWEERHGAVSDWLDTWKPKDKRRNRD